MVLDCNRTLRYTIIASPYNAHVRNIVPPDHLLEFDLFKHKDFPLKETLSSFVKSMG